MTPDTQNLRPAAVNRRDLLRMAAAGATAAVVAPRIVSAAAARVVKIDEPFDGAILHHRHGKPSAQALTIAVTGTAPASAVVTVNGQPARRAGDRFIGEVVLSQHVTEIVAAVHGDSGRGEDRVRVVGDRCSQPRYHFAVDDNIFFLRDIARQKYASLFDCFYWKTFRDLHQKYGTRFSVNISIGIERVLPMRACLAGSRRFPTCRCLPGTSAGRLMAARKKQVDQ